MKAGWQAVQLGEVCTFENGDRGENYPGRSAFVEAGIPIINAGHLSIAGIDTSEMHFITRERFELLRSGKIRRGDVLFCLRGSLGKFALNDCYDEGAIASSLIIIRPKSILDVRFLSAYLDSSLCADMIRKFENGAAQPNLGGKSLEKFIIPLPPLEEQRRIVAVLDEAFAAIATATANAEKNLANARELFDARLRDVFSTRDAGWRDTQIGQIANASYGYTEKASFEPIGPKFLRITDIQEGGVIWDEVPHCPISGKDYGRQQLKDGDIVFARTGATTGKSFLIKNPPNAVAASYLIRLRVTDPGILSEFIQLYFQTPQYWKLVLEGTSGSAQGGFNASKLAEMHFPVPSIDKQRDAVAQLSIANEQRLELESVYQSKVAALTALKQSLLHRAFSGELTSKAAAVFALNDNFATPEFAAKIVAFAYERHVAKNRVRNFGTVKAEKILHMAEAIGGIDLGRQPLREAAGPDDAAHRHATWDWARSQHFFRFNKRSSGGHDFEKLPSYSGMIENARTAIAGTPVEEAIELLVDMDRDFAELIATTYAAWNNLIIDQCATTDGDIVLAARDKWHRDKLRFDPSRFHDAIRFIRNNSIVPDGSAKRVGGQEAMLF